jgi:aspartate 1-decarboxylase
MPFNYGTSNTITDYRSSCSIDQQIMTDNGITTQAEYRLFLQRNGNKIIELARKTTEKRVTSRTS